ncbi:MAG: ribosome silencing factor [Pseudomonadota bacterium]|jgi:ribosome-associated protein|nr:ribosome silencing factor [Alphaproteobacteria bacterium]
MTEPTESLKNRLLNILDDKKAEHIQVIDLHKKSIIADYMIIATAQSSRQLYAIAEHIAIELKHHGIIPIIDGAPPTDWVVVDAGDIIIHLFRPEARTFYNLEKMWGTVIPEHEIASTH